MVGGGGGSGGVSVVVVLKFTPIIQSVVAGQAPVTLELENTPGDSTNKPNVVHACITVDAIHAPTRNLSDKVKSGVSL